MPQNETILETNNLYQFPSVGTAIVAIYNIPDDLLGNRNLNLSVNTLIGIYNGTINRWDDWNIYQLNSATGRPIGQDNSILANYYSEEEGSTFILTEAFAEWNANWENQYGFGEVIEWEISSNTLVSSVNQMLEVVSTTPYSIGYATLSSVLQYNAQLMNETNDKTSHKKEGSGESPVLLKYASLCSPFNDSLCVNPIDANNITIKKSLENTIFDGNNFQAILPNRWSCSNESGCWPFFGFTYLFSNQNVTHPNCQDQTALMKQFLDWIYSSPKAISLAESNGFVMNQTLQNQIAQELIESIDCNYKTTNWPLFVCLITLAVFIIITIISIPLFKCISSNFRANDTPSRKGVGSDDGDGGGNNSSQHHQDFLLGHDTGDGNHEGDEDMPLLSKAVMNNIPQNLKTATINFRDIKIVKPIGSGSFGQVFEANWKGIKVAVKTKMIAADNQELDTELIDFIKEANLMSILRHPNIIQFYGYQITQSQLVIVLELAERGSLLSVLRRNRRLREKIEQEEQQQQRRNLNESGPDPFSAAAPVPSSPSSRAALPFSPSLSRPYQEPHSPEAGVPINNDLARNTSMKALAGSLVASPSLSSSSSSSSSSFSSSQSKDRPLLLDFNMLRGFALDAARGMWYLHSRKPPIIHRDLKTANLLVDADYRVKVADFGLSRPITRTATLTYCGTLDYCAPEILLKSTYSQKVDVYSFGICLWQIFTGCDVHTSIHMADLIEGVTKRNLRPDSKLLPLSMARIAEACWSRNPDSRPSFNEIIDMLESATEFGDLDVKQFMRSPPSLSSSLSSSSSSSRPATDPSTQQRQRQQQQIHTKDEKDQIQVAIETELPSPSPSTTNSSGSLTASSTPGTDEERPHPTTFDSIV